MVPVDLVELGLDDIHPHPLQPRESLSDETIASILDAIELAGGYPRDLAVTVRPNGTTWEILSGHHRIEAARRAGLTTAWAFVREMGDRDSALYLASANSHAAMSSVEHGRHAAMLKRDFRVSGDAYGRAMGRTGTWVRHCVAAAEVLDDFGGESGTFAHLPASALAAAAKIADRHDRGQVLYALRDHPRSVMAITHAAQRLNEGILLGPAIREAKRVLTIGDRVAEGLHNVCRPELAALAYRADWLANIVGGLTHLLDIRNEELERINPDLSDSRQKRLFDDRVEARIRTERMAEGAKERAMKETTQAARMAVSA